MALGDNILGARVLGEDVSPAAEHVPFVEGGVTFAAPGDLSIPLLVHLWDISDSTGTVIRRLADFADAHPGATPYEVTFEGNTYETVQLSRSAHQEDVNLGLPELTLSIADPLHTVLAWMRANDWLREHTFRLRVIEYENLATPALAKDFRFRVKAAQATDAGGSVVSVTLAPPALSDLRIPALSFTRRCVNDWTRRFQTTDAEALCTYPYDPFDALTTQNMRDDSSVQMTALKRRWGWWVLNQGNLLRGRVRDTETVYSQTVTGLLLELGAGGGLVDPTIVQSDPWLIEDTTFTAPFVYKILPDVNEELDVEAPISPISFPERVLGGLLVRAVGSNDWLFWGGFRDPSAPLTGYLSRITEAGTSTDDETTTANVQTHYRILREGSTWKLYSKEDEADPWTLRQTKTFTATGDLRVGFVVANDEASPTDPGCAWLFEEFRVNAGGHQTCDRTLSDCLVRGNEYQFNGFVGMPDGFLSF